MLRRWKTIACAGLAVVGLVALSLEAAAPTVAAPVTEVRGVTIAAVEPQAAAMQRSFTLPDDVEGGARRKFWVCASAVALAVAACALSPVTGMAGIGAAVILCA